MTASRPSRILWIVNHRTLLQSEVPILESLGHEVYVPTRTPDSVDFRSAARSTSRSSPTTLPESARALLETVDFFEQGWSPSVAEIIARNFQTIVLAFGAHLTPLREAAFHFPGAVFLRAFGRERPWRYSDYLRDPQMAWLGPVIERLGPRLGFLYAYDAIAEGDEAPLLLKRGHRVTAPLPDAMFLPRTQWTGSADLVAFHCGSILDHPYYFDQYKDIKRLVGDLPHRIFGPQKHPVADPNVLPWLSRGELDDLLTKARAFVYTSREPRHLHFSPIEAMLAGTPVLFHASSLLGALAGADGPGACQSEEEMVSKIRRICADGGTLAAAVAASQRHVPELFKPSAARQEWRRVLSQFGLPVNP